MTEINSSKKVRVSIPWRGLLILLLFVGCQKVEVKKFEHPDGLAMQAKGAAGVLDHMQVGETLKLWGLPGCPRNGWMESRWDQLR